MTFQPDSIHTCYNIFRDLTHIMVSTILRNQVRLGIQYLPPQEGFMVLSKKKQCEQHDLKTIKKSESNRKKKQN